MRHWIKQASASRWVVYGFRVLSWAALTMTPASTAYGQTLEAATISKGGGVLPDGSIIVIGQPFAGTMTNSDFTIEVGAVAILAGLRTPLKAAPPHDILKNRYISIDPRGAGAANVGKDFDIRLTLISTLVSGVPAGQIGSQWWANAPDANCISIVGPTRPSMPPNWDACTTLHLTGCPIIPTSTYDILAIDGSAVSNPPLSMETQAKPGVKWWGDCVGTFTGPMGVPPNVWTAPNGTTNIDDAVAGIKTFQDPSAFNATHVSVTDLEPTRPDLPPPANQINRLVNINDVFVTILGFQGNEYPGPQIDLCPDP